MASFGILQAGFWRPFDHSLALWSLSRALVASNFFELCACDYTKLCVMWFCWRTNRHVSKENAMNTTTETPRGVESYEIAWAIQDAIDEIMSERLEYEETHDDALGNYLVGLADVCAYENTERRLMAWLDEYHDREIDASDAERLLDELLTWSPEVAAGYTLAAEKETASRFMVSLGLIGGVYDQIPLEVIQERMEIDVSIDVIRETLAADKYSGLSREGDYVEAHANSDLYVYAFWSAETILEILEGGA